MNIQLTKGETIIKEGGANHFKGVESVGGRLYLTNLRLFFKSHSLNIQNHEESYYLEDIVSTEAINTLGIVPNGMAVKLKDSREEKFVVYGRREWINKISYAQANFVQKQTTDSPQTNSSQIIINGNVSGSNIVVGSENKVSTSPKEGSTQ